MVNAGHIVVIVFPVARGAIQQKVNRKAENMSHVQEIHNVIHVGIVLDRVVYEQQGNLNNGINEIFFFYSINEKLVEKYK